MNSPEIFALHEKWESSSFCDLLCDLWMLEARIADGHECAYSWIDDCSITDRTCVLCGSICDTAACGGIPRECPTEYCAKLRSFWNINHFPSARIYSGAKKESDTYLRYGYLRSRMEKIFNTKSILDVPFELRVNFLLSAMIERMSHEKNNRRT